jgi:hypothetical protein
MNKTSKALQAHKRLIYIELALPMFGYVMFFW